jgi:hypothetical protein
MRELAPSHACLNLAQGFFNFLNLSNGQPEPGSAAKAFTGTTARIERRAHFNINEFIR